MSCCGPTMIPGNVWTPYWAGRGIQLNYTLKLNQLLTTYHLTEYGMGASFVSDTVVKCLPENPDIIYYKIDDPEAVRDVLGCKVANWGIILAVAAAVIIWVIIEKNDTGIQTESSGL